jgi:hypothetical protein
VSPEPVWQTADPEALRAALESRRAGSELPFPGPWEYLGDLMRELNAAVAGWLARQLGRELPLERLFEPVAWGLVALVLGGVLWLAGRWLLRGLDSRARPQPAVGTPLTPIAAAPLPPSDWRKLLEEHLRAGDARSALTALWWWGATTLAPAGLDESWTTRQLLAATRRRSLASALHRLDRWLYGPDPPTAREVSRLARELEELLA